MLFNNPLHLLHIGGASGGGAPCVTGPLQWRLWDRKARSFMQILRQSGHLKASFDASAVDASALGAAGASDGPGAAGAPLHL